MYLSHMQIIKIDSKHGSFDCLVDDADFEWLSQYTWGLSICRNHRYASVGIHIPLRRMHRMIASTMWDIRGKQIDHIDSNGLNNQRSNLRLCSASQNGMNQRVQRRSKQSQYKGVTRHLSARWYARVKKDGAYHCVGVLDTEREAAIAYDIRARELFGEFAKPNIPDASPEEIASVLANISNPKRRKNASSQYLGVFREKRYSSWGWNAYQRHVNKMGHGYATEIEAARARDEYIKANNLPIQLSIP